MNQPKGQTREQILAKVASKFKQPTHCGMPMKIQFADVDFEMQEEWWECQVCNRTRSISQKEASLLAVMDQ